MPLHDLSSHVDFLQGKCKVMKPKGLGKKMKKLQSGQSHLQVFTVRQTQGEQNPMFESLLHTAHTATVTWPGHVGVSKGHHKGSDQQPALKKPTSELRYADY